MIKVTEAEGTPTKTVSKIDLGLGDVPTKVADKIKDEVGQYIVEQVLKTVAQAKSPVAGEKWPKLSAKYKKIKLREGASEEANLQLYGDMMDALDFQSTDDGIEVGFIDTDEAWKADGHLKFSGEENNTPRRRFLPGDGEEFKGDIQKGIDRIIADNMSSQFNSSDFSGVETKKDLYEVLSGIFEDLSKNEIKLAVLRNEELYNLLKDEDLLDLL